MAMQLFREGFFLDTGFVLLITAGLGSLDKFAKFAAKNYFNQVSGLSMVLSIFPNVT